jgi:hypothetical protein
VWVADKFYGNPYIEMCVVCDGKGYVETAAQEYE